MLATVTACGRGASEPSACEQRYEAMFACPRAERPMSAGLFIAACEAPGAPSSDEIMGNLALCAGLGDCAATKACEAAMTRDPLGRDVGRALHDGRVVRAIEWCVEGRDGKTASAPACAPALERAPRLRGADLDQVIKACTRARDAHAAPAPERLAVCDQVTTMRLSTATEAVSAARAAQRDADQACRELAKALRLVEPPSYQPPDARRLVPPALQASSRTAMDAMATCLAPPTP